MHELVFQVDQILQQGIDNQTHYVFGARFLEQVIAVAFYSANAEVQLVGYFGRGVLLAYKHEYFYFAGREVHRRIKKTGLL